MDRLDMHTDDLAAGNVDRLGELFPSVITETIGDDGNTVRGVDFDLLRQELAGRVVDGPRERYQLDWPGKRSAAFAANAPIAKTLRPDREESVGFDTTKNLFIEGDNLDALKLLQESYLGKVKLIYIDPPYNTGKDFVYNDRFAETTDEYLTKSGQVDTEGNRLVANTESNGRFHSDWLSMMYPRLKLARNLLTDDGIIAVSIDENEMSNLTRICCEVFGSDNHIFSLSVITNPKGRSQDKYVARSHEYLIGFSRSALGAGALDIPREESDVAQRFPLEDSDGRYREHELRNTHREFGQHNRPNLYFPLYVDPESKSVSVRPSYGTVGVLPTWNDGFEGCWTWSKGKAASSTSLLVAKKVRGDWKVFRKVYAAEDGEVATRKVKSVWKDRTFHTEKGQEAFDNLFPGESKLFQAPKPIALLERIIQMGSRRDSVILDFFAGSSSLAHAVLQLNCSDGGSRRFIEVQLGEAVGNSSRAGGLEWATVAEISKERIRRAGSKLLDHAAHEDWNRDVGFRVLKVDSTNMADVLRTPDEVGQDALGQLTESVRLDRTAEDLLFQVLVDWGLELTLPIVDDHIDGHDVYTVDDGAVTACFASKITEGVLTTIAQRQPLRAVFRDDAFLDDSARINAEQIFAEASPATDIRTI